MGCFWGVGLMDFMVYAGWMLGLLVFGGFWVFPVFVGFGGCVDFFGLVGFGLMSVFPGITGCAVLGFSWGFWFCVGWYNISSEGLLPGVLLLWSMWRMWF